MGLDLKGAFNQAKGAFTSFWKSLGPGQIINGMDQPIHIIVDHKIGPLAGRHRTNGIDADGIVLGSIPAEQVTIRKGGMTSDFKSKVIPVQWGLCIKISDFSSAMIVKNRDGDIVIYNDMQQFYTNDWSVEFTREVAKKHNPIPRGKTFSTRRLNAIESATVLQQEQWGRR